MGGVWCGMEGQTEMLRMSEGISRGTGPLPGELVEALEAAGMVEHLYVHIPYCPKVCPYCSFYKEPLGRGATPEFLEGLVRELEWFAPWLKPRTIFFGGGTPSALSVTQLEGLLGRFGEVLDLGGLEEWTFEMNPATVSAQKAGVLLRHGVNRASMGVQAWQPELLRTLGRVHSAEQAVRSYEVLRGAGFGNVNVDLIFGVPGQTAEQWRESLERTASLGPEHIAAYCLTYEEDTEFFEGLRAGRIDAADEETEVEFFDLTREVLAGWGYRGYEVSNFSLPGRECRHNIAYWEGADYLGLGPSAVSTAGFLRWRNAADTGAYAAGVLRGVWPAGWVERLDVETRRRERLAFGLRMAKGVPREWVREEKWLPLAEAGLVREEDGGDGACGGAGSGAVREGVAVGGIGTKDGGMPGGAMAGGGRKRRMVLTAEGLRVADAIAAELME